MTRAGEATTGRAYRNGGRKSVRVANVRAPSEHHVIHNYTASRERLNDSPTVDGASRWP
jgi:hypothetical protein